jgi:type I restriction enzyme S subunit
MMMFYKETNFKETPIGKIPKDWEVNELEKVSVLIKSGSTPLKSRRDYWNGNIPFMTQADMTKVERYLHETSERITELGAKSSKLFIVPENSILLSMYGTIGKVVINKVPVTISQNIAAIVLNKKCVHEEYLRYALQMYSHQFKKQAKIITLKHLDIKIVKKTLLPFPHLLEQQKIALIISTVDEAIQKTNEIIAKTERLKKGLMQELLTRGIGHKEFKDSEIGRIPKDWRVVKLGSVLELCQYGLSIKMGDKGKYPIIRMDEVVDGYVISEITRYVDLDEETFRNFKLEKGDILFNRTNSYELVGRTGIFLLDGDYVFASYLIRLRPKREMADPSFLTFYLIFSNDKLRQLATRAVHQANINATNLKRFKVPLPPLGEQQKIASTLATVDGELKIERNEKARLERIKQGLMDLLITGKIRVKVS